MHTYCLSNLATYRSAYEGARLVPNGITWYQMAVFNIKIKVVVFQYNFEFFSDVSIVRYFMCLSVYWQFPLWLKCLCCVGMLVYRLWTSRLYNIIWGGCSFISTKIVIMWVESLSYTLKRGNRSPIKLPTNCEIFSEKTCSPGGFQGSYWFLATCWTVGFHHYQ